MTAPCDTCYIFTHNPEHNKYFCDGMGCPARQKIPELVVKDYLKKINNNEIDFTNIKIKLKVGKQEYEFVKKD